MRIRRGRRRISTESRAGGAIKPQAAGKRELEKSAVEMAVRENRQLRQRAVSFLCDVPQSGIGGLF